jgi:hypothetical protein
MKEIYTSQAEANQAKINKFVMSIVWQIAVFVMVVFATFQDNLIAQWMLVCFGGVLGLALFSYFIIAAIKAENLAKRDLTKLKRAITPTERMQQTIGALFSIAEIAILVSHGWIYLAIFWGVTELLQIMSVRNIQKAAELQGEDWVDRTAKEMADQAQADAEAEAFNKDVMMDLIELENDLSDIDHQIRGLFNDGFPPPEGSENYKTMVELNEARTEIVDKVEDIVIKAGLKAHKDANDE